MGEFRQGGECRAVGRTLTGPALVYGDVSAAHRERFEPGAFSDLDSRTRWLDIEHDRTRLLAWTAGGGLELRDTDDGLIVKAELPKTPLHDGVLRRVQDGSLSGFSIEFHPVEERRESGIRVVTKAELDGVAVVRDPSYGQSRAEVRAKSAFRLSGRIPINKPLTCRCHRGTCDRVRFTETAFDDAIAGDDEILLITGEFESALASKAKGTLTLRRTKDAVEVDAGLPDTVASADLAAKSGAVNLLVRPVFDQQLSDFTEADGVATYTKVHVKAVLVGASNVEGWPAATVRGKSARRSARGWL